MTYYEWITYIEEFKNKPITDEFIKKINTYDFKYPQDVMIRFYDHILKITFDKLNLIRDELENDLNKVSTPDDLSELVSKIKDTIKDTIKIQEIKYFDTSLINELKLDIERYAEDYVNTIKRHYKGTSTKEYTTIINNMHLMENV